jgi:hypothetical protein
MREHDVGDAGSFVGVQQDNFYNALVTESPGRLVDERLAVTV